MRGAHHITVIIPALNEADSIGHVLDAIPQWVDRVIVADNGSDDDTATVARRHGAEVVREPRRGYGAACLAAIAALDDRADIVVFLDGDFSDDPTEMNRLVDPVAEGRVDLVIGSRVLGPCEPGALSLPQRFGNALACSLMRLIHRARFTDLGPFRAIRRSALHRLAMNDRDFGWTVQMQVRAAVRALRYREVPVTYRNRHGGESKVSGNLRAMWAAGVKIIGTIFVELMPGSPTAISPKPEGPTLEIRNSNPERTRAGAGGKMPRCDVFEGNVRTRPRLESPRADRPRDCGFRVSDFGFPPVGFRRCRLAVFTKYPAPGEAKTRLIPAIGEQAAADLQRDMTRHVLAVADGAMADGRGEIEVRYTGGDAAEMQAMFGARWYRPQGGGDLGERLRRTAEHAFAQGVERTVIIGADCPMLTAPHIRAAFDALADHDLALGPAADGGYYLIGFRHVIAPLFHDIDWGSGRVLDQTLAAAGELDLRPAMLDELPDVDRPEDLPVWDAVRTRYWED